MPERSGGGPFEEGTGQHHSEQDHSQDSQGQQQNVAKMEDSAISFQGFPQEIHRRPTDRFEPTPVEQVDNDWHGSGERSGNRERTGVERKHW